MSNASEREPNGAIWVNSEISPDGAYVCAIHYTDDLTQVVDQDEAVAYSVTMSAAAAAAEYDAAVFKQMTKKLEVSAKDAANLLVRLRKERGGTTWHSGPLEVEAGMSAFTGEPFLRCSAGPLEWQWTPADMRSHVYNVLEVAGGVKFDTQYRRLLIDEYDLDQGRAAAVIDDLGNFRD